MLVIFVFVASFIVIFSATLVVFPSMPPGQLIFAILGNSETDYLVAGVSAELLISALINGLVWGVVILLVYSYWRGPAKTKVNLPIWVPDYTTSRGSEVKNKTQKQHIRSSLPIIKEPQDITSVEGIGYIYGRKLRKIGINTVDDLLQKGSTITGRNELATEMEVTQSTVLNWLRQAEIHR